MVNNQQSKDPKMTNDKKNTDEHADKKYSNHEAKLANQVDSEKSDNENVEHEKSSETKATFENPDDDPA